MPAVRQNARPPVDRPAGFGKSIVETFRFTAFGVFSQQDRGVRMEKAAGDSAGRGAVGDSGTPVRGGLGWPQVILVVVLAVAVTAGLTGWLASRYLFPAAFTPVDLGPRERQRLDRKLRAIGVDLQGSSAQHDTRPLAPERYSEAGASREVAFSERELNAMLATNTDLARKFAIDLSGDLVSARLLLPLDADFPVLGGRTLRVNAGIELAYRDSRPVVVVKGVSVMGVPVPNAWLGNLKHVDLVREFGAEPGFWQAFADGIEDIRVEEGRLRVRLGE